MVLKSTLADPLYLYKETNGVTQVKSLEKEQLKIQGYKKKYLLCEKPDHRLTIKIQVTTWFVSPSKDLCPTGMMLLGSF